MSALGQIFAVFNKIKPTFCSLVQLYIEISYIFLLLFIHGVMFCERLGELFWVFLMLNKKFNNRKDYCYIWLVLLTGSFLIFVSFVFYVIWKNICLRLRNKKQMKRFFFFSKLTWHIFFISNSITESLINELKLL